MKWNKAFRIHRSFRPRVSECQKQTQIESRGATAVEHFNFAGTGGLLAVANSQVQSVNLHVYIYRHRYVCVCVRVCVRERERERALQLRGHGRAARRGQLAGAVSEALSHTHTHSPSRALSLSHTHTHGASHTHTYVCERERDREPVLTAAVPTVAGLGRSHAGGGERGRVRDGGGGQLDAAAGAYNLKPET